MHLERVCCIVVQKQFTSKFWLRHTPQLEVYLLKLLGLKKKLDSWTILFSLLLGQLKSEEQVQSSDVSADKGDSDESGRVIGRHFFSF